MSLAAGRQPQASLRAALWLGHGAKAHGKKSSDALDGSVLLMVTYALLGSATANMLQSLCFVRVRSAVTAHSWIVR